MAKKSRRLPTRSSSSTAAAAASSSTTRANSGSNTNSPSRNNSNEHGRNHRASSSAARTTSTGADITTPFPIRLHDLLEAADRHSFHHIIGWNEAGTSFKIHDSKAFESEVLPNHMPTMSKYKSFIRQMNLYNFVRTVKGRETGSYSHAKFVRGDRSLCLNMALQKVKGVKKGRQQPNPQPVRSSAASVLAHGQEQGEDKQSMIQHGVAKDHADHHNSSSRDGDRDRNRRRNGDSTAVIASITASRTVKSTPLVARQRRKAEEDEATKQAANHDSSSYDLLPTATLSMDDMNDHCYHTLAGPTGSQDLGDDGDMTAIEILSSMIPSPPDSKLPLESGALASPAALFEDADQHHHAPFHDANSSHAGDLGTAAQPNGGTAAARRGRHREELHEQPGATSEDLNANSHEGQQKQGEDNEGYYANGEAFTKNDADNDGHYGLKPGMLSSRQSQGTGDRPDSFLRIESDCSPISRSNPHQAGPQHATANPDALPPSPLVARRSRASHHHEVSSSSPNMIASPPPQARDGEKRARARGAFDYQPTDHTRQRHSSSRPAAEGSGGADANDHVHIHAHGHDRAIDGYRSSAGNSTMDPNAKHYGGGEGRSMQEGGPHGNDHNASSSTPTRRRRGRATKHDPHDDHDQPRQAEDYRPPWRYPQSDEENIHQRNRHENELTPGRSSASEGRKRSFRERGLPQSSASSPTAPQHVSSAASQYHHYGHPSGPWHASTAAAPPWSSNRTEGFIPPVGLHYYAPHEATAASTATGYGTASNNHYHQQYHGHHYPPYPQHGYGYHHDAHSALPPPPPPPVSFDHARSQYYHHSQQGYHSQYHNPPHHNYHGHPHYDPRQEEQHRSGVRAEAYSLDTASSSLATNKEAEAIDPQSRIEQSKQHGKNDHNHADKSNSSSGKINSAEQDPFTAERRTSTSFAGRHFFFVGSAEMEKRQGANTHGSRKRRKVLDGEANDEVAGTQTVGQDDTKKTADATMPGQDEATLNGPVADGPSDTAAAGEPNDGHNHVELASS